MASGIPRRMAIILLDIPTGRDSCPKNAAEAVLCAAVTLRWAGRR
jgi:hypothetical protein